MIQKDTGTLSPTYHDLIQSQRHYFSEGETRSIDFRLRQLRKLKSAILTYENEIARALHKDLGKSYHEAVTTEIGFTLSEINTIIKKLKVWSKKKKVRTNLFNIPSKSFIIREPYGLNLIIGPWNYPFQLALAPLVGAIAGGNTAILKPSELAPHTSQVIKDLIEATFPSSYLAVVLGGVVETSLLLEERFDLIFFTGSTKVGRIIMEKAAHHLTPVLLELGGKSPVIIDETANLEIAAKRLVFGKTINAGQTCVAPDYVLIKDTIKEAFYDQLLKVQEAFYGKDMASNQDYGRIINEANYKRVRSYISDGRLIMGGHTDDASLHIDFTVVEVSNLQAPIMKEEIFGPVLPVITYETLDEIISIIHQNPDPLALYIFSHNKKLINHIIHHVPFGGGCINDTIMHLTNDHLPFGGRGTSGTGNYHGKSSFEAFTHPKSILQSGTLFDLKLKYPPFDQRTLALVKKLMY